MMAAASMIAYAKELLLAEDGRNNKPTEKESTERALPNQLIVPKLQRTVLQQHAAERVLSNLRKNGGGLYNAVWRVVHSEHSS